MLGAHRGQRCEVGGIAIHGEDALADDQRPRMIASRALQDGAQRVGVVVTVRLAPAPGQAGPGMQTGVRKLIEDDHVAFRYDGGNDTEIRMVTRAEHACGLRLLELGEVVLERLVKRVRAHHEARSQGATAQLGERLFRGLDHRRMLGQTQVVVRSESDVPSTVQVERSRSRASWSDGAQRCPTGGCRELPFGILPEALHERQGVARTPKEAQRRSRTRLTATDEAPKTKTMAIDVESRTSPAAAEWTVGRALALFEQPFFDLLRQAHEVHRAHFDPAEVQLSQLLSIKTGGCSEDCAYCPQASRYDDPSGREALMAIEDVVVRARRAKEQGATRFCMGAAWRSPKKDDLAVVVEMVKRVKALGLETCATLGMLDAEQARSLRDAGLDYYNHNIDTDPSYYGEIITTRRFADRIETLGHVRESGMKVCCGGIVGMGESRRQRAGMLVALANLPEPPESVPINRLVQVEGTPLHGTEALDPFEFVRTIAVARIAMPRSRVRLSAGREDMTDELQALCFFAGANSIFYGEKLLTTPNPESGRDASLFERLGLRPTQVDVES